jgi:hypothetical protein
VCVTITGARTVRRSVSRLCVNEVSAKSFAPYELNNVASLCATTGCTDRPTPRTKTPGQGALPTLALFSDDRFERRRAQSANHGAAPLYHISRSARVNAREQVARAENERARPGATLSCVFQISKTRDASAELERCALRSDAADRVQNYFAETDRAVVNAPKPSGDGERAEATTTRVAAKRPPPPTKPNPRQRESPRQRFRRRR